MQNQKIANIFWSFSILVSAQELKINSTHPNELCKLSYHFKPSCSSTLLFKIFNSCIKTCQTSLQTYNTVVCSQSAGNLQQKNCTATGEQNTCQYDCWWALKSCQCECWGARESYQCKCWGALKIYQCECWVGPEKLSVQLLDWP